MQRKFTALLLIAWSILVGHGCSSGSGYKRPISNFQNASSIVISSTGSYLTELNKVERGAYIDKHTASRKPITLIEINNSQVFLAEQIETRLKALGLLAQYGELIGQLANSDVPERISSNAEHIGSTLSKLSKEISESRSESKSDFSKAIGPVSSIVGDIAKLAVERKMEAALEKAISKGETPVIRLIDTIRNDIVIAYQRKKNALSAKRVALIDKYNIELNEVVSGAESPFELETNATELKSFLDRWEALPYSNPDEGLKAMKEAHKALVDYSKSAKNDQDLLNLVEAMEVFTSRANRVAAAIHELQDL